MLAELSQLGHKVDYEAHYNPDKLFPIERQTNRALLGITSENLPFHGWDHWNHYEVSWLNEKGKPCVALAQIIYSCASPCIIEAKSMKLYFNTFNNTAFPNLQKVQETIQQDIAKRIQSDVIVKIIPVNTINEQAIIRTFEGTCIDEHDITCDIYKVDASLLAIEESEEAIVQETLFSHLLKSNCLVTGQPDWGSVQITYQGPKINQEALLRYLVSFRNHNEFHEQCIERIFMDIMQYCHPTQLTVQGQYTRRGGIDINPSRSTHPILPPTTWRRLCRQ